MLILDPRPTAPDYRFGDIATPRTTFEQERQEAFEAVLAAMTEPSPDPDRTAACLHLLRHLGSSHA
jgi:hypothetical protein